MKVSEFEIRDFRESDYKDLVFLWEKTGLGSPERGDDLETIMRCNALGGRLIVMTKKDGDVLVGSCWMTVDGRRTHLHHFGILPEYQNTGLGKKLVQASLACIKEIGYQVKLEVHKNNLIAKKLYQKAGFFSFVDYDIMMIREVKRIGSDPSGK
jgi:ribosomal protein S18 acetylase RimI-like enzyme